MNPDTLPPLEGEGSVARTVRSVAELGWGYLPTPLFEHGSHGLFA